jgi:3',5'-cyclic-AMP phosphodiesterase
METLPPLCENEPISVLVPSLAPLWECRVNREPAGLVTHLVQRPARSAAQPLEAAAAEVHWALLADPHISADPGTEYCGSRPAEHAREAVAQVLKAGPQAALIAGDLAWDEGLPGDYTRLRAILEPLAAQLPVCLMLGNHDNRSAFLAEFAAAYAQAEVAVEKSLAVIEHGPIRWILLDSLYRTDIVPGLLGKMQRHWLRGLLETPDQRPVLIVVHHPPDEDDDSLLDGDRLLRLIEPFPQVKAVFTAHVHAFGCGSREGIHLVSLPALGMPFDAAEAIGWIEASLSTTRGVFTFHTVGKSQAAGRNQTRDGAVTTLSWR